MHMNLLEEGEVVRLTADPITTTQLVKYAGASGDFNRIHFDEPFARAQGLKAVLAHGMLTMAIVGRCLEQAVGESAYVEEFSSQFLAPVWVGDVVEATARLAERGEGEGVLELSAAVEDRMVLRGRARVRWN